MELHWAKYLLAVINGAVMVITLVLLGLMVVMLLFQLGGEGWFVMGLDVYKRQGFQVYKRTDLDEQGNPYPLLYMSLNI